MIATILSDPVQTDLSKHGKMTVLKDQTIKQQFGSDTKFKDKNIKSMAALKFSIMAPIKYLGDGNDAMNLLIQSQLQKK